MINSTLLLLLTVPTVHPVFTLFIIVIYNNAREISTTVRRYLAVRPSSIEIQQILRKHRIYHGFEACQAASLLSLGLAGIFSDLAATCNAVYPVEERR